MRVAIVLPGFCADESDWGIPVLRQFVSGLGLEHETRVYAVFYPNSPVRYTVGRAKVQSFGRPRSNFLLQFEQMWRLERALRADHARNPFDVVHGFWADHGGIPATRVGHRLGLPVLLTLIGAELDYVDPPGHGKARTIKGMLARRAARRADAVTTISEYHHRRLQRHAPWLDTRMRPFGVDTAMFGPDGPRADLGPGRHVVQVASFVTVKAHDVAIDAIARVARSAPDVVLHLVGEGPRRAAIEDHARRSGVADRVRFHGRLAYDDLPPLFRAADVCLLSSWFETSAMVVMEAAACGRITVGSDVGSMGEFAPREFLCDAGDPAAMAAVVERALTVDRGPIESRVLDRVRADYTVDAMMARYLDEYARLVRGG